MRASRYNLVFRFKRRSSALVLNPLAGTMDVVPAAEHDLLDVIEGIAPPGGLASQDTEALFARGYLVADPREEEHRLAALTVIDDHDDYPVDFLLFPTFACNLKCSYCFQGERPPDRLLIDTEHVEAAFAGMTRIVDRLRPAAVPVLYLFGGEPLLRGRRPEQVVRLALARARGLGLRVGVITNGATLLDFAATLATGGVEFVQVTLDGPRDTHDRRRPFRNGSGSFDAIVAGAEALRGTGVTVYVRVNLDAETIESLPAFCAFAHEAGWDRPDLVLFVGPYRDLLCRSYALQLPEPAMLARLFELRDRHPSLALIKTLGWPGMDYVQHYLRTGRLPGPRLAYCISSYGRFAFDASGAIYACATAAGDPDNAVGRYHPDLDLDPARLGDWRRRRFTDSKSCRQCPAGPLCGGGCTLQSRLKHGGRQPVCPEVLGNMQVILDHYFDTIVAGTPCA